MILQHQDWRGARPWLTLGWMVDTPSASQDRDPPHLGVLLRRGRVCGNRSGDGFQPRLYFRRTGTPRGIEILLTPTALFQLVQQGKELFSDQVLRALAKRSPISKSRRSGRVVAGVAPPTSAQIFQYGATFSVHAIAADTACTDFYFVAPRAFLNAGTSSVIATPVVACSLDIWRFAALLVGMEGVIERRLSSLDARSYLPTMEKNEPTTS